MGLLPDVPTSRNSRRPVSFDARKPTLAVGFPADLVVLGGLVAVTVFGVIGPNAAWDGSANPALLTVGHPATKNWRKTPACPILPAAGVDLLMETCADLAQLGTWPAP